jgi:hypothetical protein
LIKDIPLLEFTQETQDLANERPKVLPEKAAFDVLHIAITVVNELDFLLTLNCKHIANAFIF